MTQPTKHWWDHIWHRCSVKLKHYQIINLSSSSNLSYVSFGNQQQDVKSFSLSCHTLLAAHKLCCDFTQLRQSQGTSPCQRNAGCSPGERVDSSIPEGGRYLWPGAGEMPDFSCLFPLKADYKLLVYVWQLHLFPPLPKSLRLKLRLCRGITH